jgi:hypothetical protein
MVSTDNAQQANDSGSALKLVSILKGEFEIENNEQTPQAEAGEKINFFRDGVKLDNTAMRILLTRLQEKYDYDDQKLLQIYLLFDQAVEEGVLTQQTIDNLELD